LRYMSVKRPLRQSLTKRCCQSEGLATITTINCRCNYMQVFFKY